MVGFMFTMRDRMYVLRLCNPGLTEENSIASIMLHVFSFFEYGLPS